MDGSLFDFSRYNSAIKNFFSNKGTFLFFNDTLGNGRKLSIFLIVFILISLLKLQNNKYTVAGPLDSDENGSWLCPYFFVCRSNFFDQANFVNWKIAEMNIPESIKDGCQRWIQQGWRNAATANETQKEIKYRTLLLEHNLLNNISLDEVIKFNRLSILRILNSLFGK